MSQARPTRPASASSATSRRAARAANGQAHADSSPVPLPTNLAADLPHAHAARPDVVEGSTRLNRDLSWLQFNARVLHQALDDDMPLLERVKFLGIFTSNLDEFVMKRVGFWLAARESHTDPDREEIGGVTPEHMLLTIRSTFEHLEEQQADCFERQIRPALRREGIDLLKYAELSSAERSRIDAWFEHNVFPVVTPLAVDEGHRFPFISNLSANLAVLVREARNPRDDKADAAPLAEPVFARIKVPTGMRSWIRVPEAAPVSTSASTPARPSTPAAPSGRGKFVQLWEILAANLDMVFPGCEIVEVMPFRVTRAAETVEDDRDDMGENTLLEEVQQSLHRRKFAPVVRLEVPREASPRLLRQLTEVLELTTDDVDPLQGLVDFRSVFEIADLPRPDLKHKPWTPVIPARLRESGRSIFDEIRRGDILVHHPYESFEHSAQRFIAEAATDPNVLAIKQTIYRTSRESPFVAHLIKAAESGKQVACLVELRARFDESRNVKLAQLLEKAGVHVAYGVVGLKTHCKAALVVRREEGALRTYAHLGTGNYNPATAGLYTDLGLFTCDPRITQDAVHLFNLLTGRSFKTDYNSLLVAPRTMKRRFIELINREIAIAKAFAKGESPVGGRIIAKMNAMEDREVTDALYEASAAGVQIDLIVRGFCCLRPGVPGLSENIRVSSVIGRFLEHSRLFYFGAGQAEPLKGDWYIASADWMSRNLDGRVEAACPVYDPQARGKLLHMLQIMLEDRRNAWTLGPDGHYTQLTPRPDAPAKSAEALGTFESLMRQTVQHATLGA
ncbi:MAG: polyphosphate kinase 1 [Phycisphaerales bacterium]|jgi:polyphosphate kinase|nr:polyphosphate kinase 1 [Phycisphaerales bacterium]